MALDQPLLLLLQRVLLTAAARGSVCSPSSLCLPPSPRARRPGRPLGFKLCSIWKIDTRFKFSCFAASIIGPPSFLRCTPPACPLLATPAMMIDAVTWSSRCPSLHQSPAPKPRGNRAFRPPLLASRHAALLYVPRLLLYLGPDIGGHQPFQLPVKDFKPPKSPIPNFFPIMNDRLIMIGGTKLCTTDMRCTAAAALAALVAPAVLANTEITNFAASLRPGALAPRAREWPVLRPRTTTHWVFLPAPLGTALADVCPHAPDTSDDPCAHERWFVLDLPDAQDAKYTLRLSYPTSSPADFTIDIHDPLAAAAFSPLPPQSLPAIPAPTRRKYARIRAISTGVRTPPSSFPYPFLPVPNATQRAEPEQVPIVLALEPLLLGLLPASLAPLLAAVAVLLLFLARVVRPRVLRALEAMAAEAREEAQVRAAARKVD
ncbi:hypothetical protein GGX14DRAFT_656119 [Mycena pura]|uniref:Protein PBN1 n=1 Tax=Mycena pura TaxID=153505 RepID=A0AAD6Y9S9_9AGAR|nr:hypothetical protein GGX14DRAFT_656119 [Mycena pura]